MVQVITEGWQGCYRTDKESFIVQPKQEKLFWKFLSAFAWLKGALCRFKTQKIIVYNSNDAMEPTRK